MKKKVLLTSILSIVLCLSLMVGATFALFTSTSTVNIAVTSAKVSVVAKVNNLQYKTLNVTEWTDATNNVATFDNIGSSAVLDETAGTVTIDKIVPGDAIKVNVDVENTSTVRVQYKIQMVIEGELAPALKTSTILDGVETKIYNGATAWKVLESGNTIDSFPIIVEFADSDSNNDYKGKNANITFIVHAIQGNADTSQVGTVSDLMSAIACGDDATLTNDIVLDETIVIPENKEISIDLNGKNLIAPAGEYAISNENGGTLYLGDSSLANTYSLRRNTVLSGGVVEGVVYTAEGSTTIVNGGVYSAKENEAYVFLNYKGTLIINDATINGGSSYPIYSYNDGHKLVINNATVNGKFGCINAYAAGTVEVNGGNFYMTGVSGKTSHLVYMSGTTKMTINGGNFVKLEGISMSATGGGGICTASSSEIIINGGNFAGDYRDIYVWSATSKITVNAGNFKFSPTSEGAKIGAESTVTQNADGTYTVVKA